MVNGYDSHAAVWDWDGYDRTPEYDYWCSYARRYGDKVLIPMCALAEAGAYLARQGFRVTAFDISAEMVYEGRKRFDSVQNLSLHVADIRDFRLDERDFDFAFLATQDLHLLSDIEAVKQAFASLAVHLRRGGCLALELVLPPSESYEYPKRVYHPRVPNYSDKSVWKEGEGRYDAATKRHHIIQTVYVRDRQGTSSFPYNIVLQYYERESILDALSEAGFAVAGEYGSRAREPLTPQHGEWAIEAVRR